MPLYEYRCASCGDRFELLQRVGDDSRAVSCPECGAAEVERCLSTFAAATGGRSSPAADFGGCGRPQCGTGFT